MTAGCFTFAEPATIKIYGESASDMDAYAGVG